MALQPGDPAPEVTARNQAGETVSPAFAEPTVLYFYPRDGTPGCTLEAREFEADIESFRRTGAAVYLLADPDGTVADAFDVEVQGDFVDRVTFVLADGEVHEVVDADTMNPEGHAADVLEAVEAVAE
ncbi:peroxiredoxin [Halobacteriales archaeon QH_7_69_31]|nr:MAG: peroxiredoxin [Halobacteriales archaeon QH_7_69_31]